VEKEGTLQMASSYEIDGTEMSPDSVKVQSGFRHHVCSKFSTADTVLGSSTEKAAQQFAENARKSLQQ
jgi:hypothetical protein